MQAVHAYTLPPDKYIQAVQYAQARHALEFAGFAVSLLVLLAVIRLRIAPRWRDWHPLPFSAAILLLVSVFDLPVDACRHFFSVRYGISIETWPAWLLDWGKEQGLSAIVAALLIWPFYAFLRRRPRGWSIPVWLASLPLLLAGTFAGPLLIEPMFNRFQPLEKNHPDLVVQIERLLGKAGVDIPPSRLYEMDASARTTALNAYVSGFGASRRVVLYDTIIRKENGPPLLTTVGHELGHYVLGHIEKGLAFAAALLLIALLISEHVVRAAVQRWGARLDLRSTGDRATLPLFLLLFLLLGFIAEPLSNAFSRVLEHQADVYSLEATHGVVPDAGQAAAQAFQIEGETDLDPPDPSPLAVFWFYSHPPTSERLRFSLDYDPWRAGRKPRYVP
ncbi:MAG: M48 family metalloprotease [Acidobacteriota bacterium]|nr:M48 family metalloprotease [Acidobacteriota bacterium]